MKKWQFEAAKKHLAKIIENVLQGEIQGIITSSGEIVYLIPGEKYNQVENREDKGEVFQQLDTGLITPAI